MGKSEPGDNPASAFERAARRLLAGRPSDSNSAKQVSARAAQSLERLSTHLARILGATGVHMLMERSIASSQFPHAMENQNPETITDAFVDVLSSFVGLLKKLIGDGLVERLLHEVWPAIFVPAEHP
ncbi:MAG TPA: hypothetical protein VMZ53_22395 [Kofleriaceae bacterium]|nr:hypothetical protein [Kofleriaceae bacterium]